MKILKLVILALMIVGFYSCTKSNQGKSAKIKASFLSITPKVFQQYSEDTIHIFLNFSDDMRTAVYVVLSDSRWDSIPPRFILLPEIPTKVDTRNGVSGVMELQVPMSEVRVVDPLRNRETYAYRAIIIGQDSAVNSSDFVWTDSITVTR